MPLRVFFLAALRSGKGFKPKTLAQLLVAFGSAKAGDDAPDVPSASQPNEDEGSNKGE